jgi:hypothetical protein
MTLPAAAAAGAVAFTGPGAFEAADDATADRDFAAADSAGGLDVVAAAVCLAAISASFRAFLSSSLRASACFAASAAWSALTLTPPSAFPWSAATAATSEGFSSTRTSGTKDVAAPGNLGIMGNAVGNVAADDAFSAGDTSAAGDAFAGSFCADCS